MKGGKKYKIFNTKGII